jgi:enoyl-CoA hydratase/carnithine racemase
MSETSSVLRIDDADGVRLCTLDRPEALNAFNQDLWYALAEALAEAAADDALRCAVITGAGRAFSAGQDLSELADPAAYADRPPGYQALMPVLETFPKPLLAAVNGVGVGIGLTILPYCDLVLISTEARLKTPFISLGVTTEASSSLLLPMTMGWQRANELIYTERWLSADDAVETGLALRTVAPDQLMDETMTLARHIGGLPLAPLVATKKLLAAARVDAIQAARDREMVEFETLVRSMMDAAT